MASGGLKTYLTTELRKTKENKNVLLMSMVYLHPWTWPTSSCKSDITKREAGNLRASMPWLEDTTVDSNTFK